VLTSAKYCGISGSIYTQLTDVEAELNGFFTYDRQVRKLDFDRVTKANKALVKFGR
jgi:hypothetical protein